MNHICVHNFFTLFEEDNSNVKSILEAIFLQRFLLHIFCKYSFLHCLLQIRCHFYCGIQWRFVLDEHIGQRFVFRALATFHKNTASYSVISHQ